MKKILLLLLTFSLFFACNKDDEPTPENWTEDDNIFRCKVNGVDWEPEGDGISFSGGNLDIYYESFFLNAIQIQASKDNDDVNEFISLGAFVEKAVIGNYDISSNILFVDHNCASYFRDTLTENKVRIITIDSINNILEGEFNFSANKGNNDNCTVEKVTITNGYFKAKYRN
jgi:hypothetical protein